MTSLMALLDFIGLILLGGVAMQKAILASYGGCLVLPYQLT
ncbi:hypothetical protein [Noviherbaspirillum sp. Root189]|nr:hypothetical protein [Noviherbaspirillum sp. Root189]